MTNVFTKLHEDMLDEEIKHEENVIRKEQDKIRKHDEEMKKENQSLGKDIHDDEIHAEEKKIVRESHRLDRHEEKLGALKGGKYSQEEACEKAEEFKELADKARNEKIIDEDLFETPIQPLH